MPHLHKEISRHYSALLASLVGLPKVERRVVLKALFVIEIGSFLFC
jgi:hypothetical protein